MTRPTRVLPALVLALALAACQGDPTKPGGGKPTGPQATAAVPKPGSLAAARAGLVGLDGATLIGLDGSTLIGMDGSTLIGMDGSTLIGNDGSTLIGNDGSTLVGNDGASIAGSVRAPAGLVAGAVSDMGGLYRLAQAGEKPLAGVTVYLRTATGRFVFDPKTKKLLAAVTDAQGRYSFANLKALRGLTAFVPQARDGATIRGLAGMRPADAAANAPVEIDLSSSLQAQWIYTRLLAAQAEKDRPASLDRLTTKLADEARAAINKVAAQAAAASLDPAALADAADRLGKADAGVAKALEAIREVVGRIAVASNVAGRGLTGTAFLQPQDISLGADGALFVLESFGGVVRRFDPDGKDVLVAGLGSPTEGAIGALQPTDLAVGPDGQVYVCSLYARQILKFSPDGRTYTGVAGGGPLTNDAATGKRATEVRIPAPGGLAFDREGRLLFGEGDRTDDDLKGDSRIFRVEADGTLTELPSPWPAGQAAVLPHNEQREVLALAVGADGTTYVLEFREGALHRLPPGGTAWTLVARDLSVNGRSDILALPNGDMLVSEGLRGNEPATSTFGVRRVKPDGKVEPFAGGNEQGAEIEDRPAATARFSEAAGLALRPDGSVLISDHDAGLVRAAGADGVVRLVAGKPAGVLDFAKSATLSVPSGIALDPQGRVVVSEYAGHAVRRQEGDQLVTIAGGLPGRAAPGAAADRLLRPVGLAFDGPDMLVIEEGNRRLSRVRGAGPGATLEVVAGGGDEDWTLETATVTRREARKARFRDLFGVAHAPGGPTYIADGTRIWKVGTDGMMDLVTGGGGPLASSELMDPKLAERDGQPARGLRTGRFSGMVVGKDGTLYASEFSTCRVVAIGPDGIFRTHVGAGLAASINAILGQDAANEPDGPPLEARLLMPMGLAFDAQDRLYIAEVGTRAAQALAAATPDAMKAIPIYDGRIRMIDADGKIKTLAGLGSAATGDAVRNPVGIVVTPAGKIIFVDNGTNQVKEL